MIFTIRVQHVTHMSYVKSIITQRLVNSPNTPFRVSECRKKSSVLGSRTKTRLEVRRDFAALRRTPRLESAAAHTGDGFRSSRDTTAGESGARRPQNLVRQIGFDRGVGAAMRGRVRCGAATCEKVRRPRRTGGCRGDWHVRVPPPAVARPRRAAAPPPAGRTDGRTESCGTVCDRTGPCVLAVGGPVVCRTATRDTVRLIGGYRRGFASCF